MKCWIPLTRRSEAQAVPIEVSSVDADARVCTPTVDVPKKCTSASIPGGAPGSDRASSVLPRLSMNNPGLSSEHDRLLSETVPVLVPPPGTKDRVPVLLFAFKPIVSEVCLVVGDGRHQPKYSFRIQSQL